LQALYLHSSIEGKYIHEVAPRAIDTSNASSSHHSNHFSHPDT
jgi:hypothetical protein